MWLVMTPPSALTVPRREEKTEVLLMQKLGELLPNMWQDVTLKVGKEVSQFLLCCLYICSMSLIVAVKLKRMNLVERSLFIGDTPGSMAWCDTIRRYAFLPR